MIMTVRSLEQYRRQINLHKPHKISDFIRKSPKLFELYKDQRGVLWCGLTEEGEDLLDEHDMLIEENGDKAAEHVTRCLMMSVDKKLPLDKIVHFRRDFGFPLDFRINWVHKFPQHFKVVKLGDGEEYLELVSWNPAWAITELEKKTLGLTEENDHKPGMLSLAFPVKFPPSYKKMYWYRRNGRERELLEIGSGDHESLSVGFEKNDDDDDVVTDDDEMDIDEVNDAYKENSRV